MKKLFVTGQGKIRKHLLWTLAAVLFAAFYFSLPEPLFRTPYATVLYDRHGKMLSAKIARDGQWRFPPPDSVPYKFRQCILQFEDAYFYRHPGVNPVSLVKALAADVKAGKIVRGGSTLTMQTVRLALGKGRRSIGRKLLEMILALRLEWRYSKDEILKLYAAQAPFGGNVVGLEAAAWRYFGRPPEKLSWAESATLAVLPNAPALIHPGRNRTLLLRKRNRLLDKLYKQHIIDSLTCALAKEEPLPGKPKPLPQLAAHLLERAIASGYEGRRIHSTIDKTLQQNLRQIARRHYRYLSAAKVFNTGIIVLNTSTGEILGYLGNVPGQDVPSHAVDMVTAPRSTGSILKPFLYARALKDGLILPRSLLPDIPTEIAGYHPKNFDRTYSGAVPAGEALARSLNVPAVRLLQTYGVQRFLDDLHRLGLSTIQRPAEHYGLSLILGGAEARLDEITGAYASMGRVLMRYNRTGTYDGADYYGPVFVEQTSRKSRPNQDDIFGAENIWFVFKALSDKDRPVEGEDWNIYTSARKIAWKTGTSFGHRDAWCVGVTPGYTVGVWVGNATGEGRPGITGTRTAAPLMFDVFKILPGKSWFQKPELAMKKARVCEESGFLASPKCPHVRTEFIPGNGERSRVCPYHITVHLDSTGTYRVNSRCYPVNKMITRNMFILPPVMGWYYRRRHPEYQGLPRALPGCSDDAAAMALVYPVRRARIFLPRDLDSIRQKMVVEATHNDPQAVIYWHLDGRFIRSTRGRHRFELYVTPGHHVLGLVDSYGHALKRHFELVDRPE